MEDRAGHPRKPCAAATTHARFARGVSLEPASASWHIVLALSKGPDMETNAVTVLVVDDNQDLAENIAEILGLRGYAALIATSAEEALPRALAEHLDLLVTDFRLPGMSGAELVRLLREKRHDLRAVVISAYTDDLTIAAARSAGADFLPKPVDLGALARLLSAA